MGTFIAIGQEEADQKTKAEKKDLSFPADKRPIRHARKYHSRFCHDLLYGNDGHVLRG